MKKQQNKIRVGVIFGGRSGEHEVSLVSATSVINALDPEKYEIVPIGITKEGRWLSSKDALKLLKSGKNLVKIEQKIIVPEPNQKSLVKLHSKNSSPNSKKIDVIFPVLHGTYGEDGTVQGLLELANIPYVGAGVLASAVGMDKVVQKQLFEQAGLPITEYVYFLFKKFSRTFIDEIENKLGYPNFIKPSNLGSSVGITKAHNREGLIKGIETAGEYDRKIMIEKAVQNAREIECSVLGNDDPIASVPGEIIPSNEFYDYDAKYVDGKSQAVIPAELPLDVSSTIKELSIKAFKTLNCSGMARVDFLVTRNENKIFVNEINTIPGFTSISMYPKLWEASGITYSELLDRLIELALEKYEEKSKLKTTFQPKNDWYKKD
jgi:D-alanine-D-alanine ligase